MTTILTTTGISLIISTARKYNTKEPTDDQMRQHLRMEPKIASAEANSLLQIAQPDDHIVLLHTDTSEARRCADLLQDFFEKEGYKHVRLVPLEFQEDAQHIETTGLRSLVDTLIHEVEKAQGKQHEVIINATAGFKAQVVYSTMIGMIYHVPVKYIYEKFQRIVTFNPIALDWDTSLFLTYDKFFQWLDAEPRTQKDVENYLKDLPDRESIKALLTPPDADGEVFLSYMGEALQGRFKRETEEAELALWPPSAEVENEEDKIASSLRNITHHYPKGTLAICNKIARLPYVQAIIGGNFENTTLARVKGINEDGTIRLLWADDEKATNLIVQTTAQGRPQTRKVAEKIRELLETE